MDTLRVLGDSRDTRPTSFWLELKVHRLKSLKSIALRPHQIAWQTRYFMNKGQVYNLVHHPSSSTLNIFGGERAIKMGETKGHAPLEPDWCCSSPFDWHGVINHILLSSSRLKSSQVKSNLLSYDEREDLVLRERKIDDD